MAPGTTLLLWDRVASTDYVLWVPEGTPLTLTTWLTAGIPRALGPWVALQAVMLLWLVSGVALALSVSLRAVLSLLLPCLPWAAPEATSSLRVVSESSLLLRVVLGASLLSPPSAIVLVWVCLVVPGKVLLRVAPGTLLLLCVAPGTTLPWVDQEEFFYNEWIYELFLSLWVAPGTAGLFLGLVSEMVLQAGVDSGVGGLLRVGAGVLP